MHTDAIVWRKLSGIFVKIFRCNYGRNFVVMDVSACIENNIANFENLMSDCADIKKKQFSIGKNFDTKCYLAYIEVTVSNVSLADSVIGKMITMLQDKTGEEIRKCVVNNSIGLTDVTQFFTIEETVQGMLTGDAVLFVDGISCGFKIAVNGYPSMGVTECDNEPNIRGSKESFADSVKINTTLIRKRIRSNNLKVKEIQVGVRSNTTVSIVYISDIVKEGLIKNIEDELSKYDIDGIFDSGMLIQLMEQSENSPFPQYQATQRPDRAAMAVLEGRAVLLVDNSPVAVLLPANYNSFFVTTDDYYNRWEIATMERIIRYIASYIAMFLPGLYLAIIQYHSQVVPTTLILTFASSRIGVPFSPFVEVFLMEIAFELLREAGIRIPGGLGNAIGIVGGLIVGQAAVDAGLVSPIVVIIVALTALASFCIPNEEFGSAYRLIKFAMLLAAAFFGIYGVILGSIVLMIHLCSLKSLDYDFLMVSDDKKNENIIRKASNKLLRRSVYAADSQKVRLRKRGTENE